MARKTRKAPKRERAERAAIGGSAVARAAYTRPGGLHGRRKPARRIDRERAVREES